MLKSIPVEYDRYGFAKAAEGYRIMQPHERFTDDMWFAYRKARLGRQDYWSKLNIDDRRNEPISLFSTSFFTYIVKI